MHAATQMQDQLAQQTPAKGCEEARLGIYGLECAPQGNGSEPNKANRGPNHAPFEGRKPEYLAVFSRALSAAKNSEIIGFPPLKIMQMEPTRSDDTRANQL